MIWKLSTEAEEANKKCSDIWFLADCLDLDLLYKYILKTVALLIFK